MSWQAGREACRLEHPDLHPVVINSALEQKTLAKYLTAINCESVAAGGYWWFSVAVSGCWWLLMAVGDCWRLLVTVGGCWWWLAVVGGCWRLLVAVSGCWWLLVAVGGLKMSSHWVLGRLTISLSGTC